MRKDRKRATEAQLVGFFEARRGDLSLWSGKPSKANIKPGGSTVFSVRFSRLELDFLRQRAEAQGVTMSELIRRSVLKTIEQPDFGIVSPREVVMGEIKLSEAYQVSSGLGTATPEQRIKVLSGAFPLGSTS